MNKTKIIIGINIIFIVLIIMAFLPALKSGDEGYNTKTAAVTPVQQEEVTTEEMVEPEPVEVPEVAVTEEQESSVTMMEDSVKEEGSAEKAAVNDAVSTAESTVAEVEATVTDEPIVPSTEAVTPAAEEATPTTEATASPATAELYSVVDGNKLDAHSYAGFKLFRNWCARCHGTYGQGMVGPNLADSLKIISKEQFYDTVENGKSGRIGSMPSWKANVQVMENQDQLYAYLKARSDGAIGVEKPQKQ